MMQEIKIETGTSWHGSENLRDFINFLISEGFSVNAEMLTGSGIIVTASKWNERNMEGL